MKDTNNNKSVIIRNSISGVVQKILTVILVFVSIPLFISHLGVDNYGLFAVVSVIGNLNMFANFGLNMALFVSLSGTTDKRKMSTNIIVSIFLMLVISATIALLLFAFKEPILNFILDASQKQIAEAKELFNYLLISNIFLFVGQSFTAILDSQQKIYLTNLLQFVYNLIYWLGLIIVVSFNGSLPEIGMMSLGASIVWFMSISIVSCKLFGKIYISKRLGDYIEDGKKQFKYGCKVYVSSLVGFMFEPLSKLLLSKFIGLGAVSLFEIALKVRSNLNELIIKALYPIQPYISRSEEKTHLYNTLKDLSLKIEYFCFQFAALLIFIIPPILDYWLPEDMFMEFSAFKIYLFTVSLTVTLMIFSPPVYPVYVYLLTKNKVAKTINVQFLSVVVNLLLFLLLYRFLGEESIIVSNFMAYFSSYVLCIYYQTKYWQDSYITSLKSLFNIIVSIVPALVVGFGIYMITGNPLLRIIMVSLMFPIITLIISKHMRFITKDDLKKYLPEESSLRNNLIKMFGE